ncbi:MAG: hypothetical protein R2838_20655 [Caldilineaceae bacterium]
MFFRRHGQMLRQQLGHLLRRAPFVPLDLGDGDRGTAHRARQIRLGQVQRHALTPHPVAE